MFEPYKVLVKGAEAETELKKSRFIATLIPVTDEDAAKEFVSDMKKKYYDARHNCYAYIIGPDGEQSKFSDDGEPSQTAGLPMYNVLKESGVRNACVVVTRYFGGTLLGTGPLSRMYAEAVKLALEASECAWMRYGVAFSVSCDYPDAEKIKRYLEKEKVEVVDITYAEKVRIEGKTGFEAYEKLKEDVVSITASRAVTEKEKEAYFIDRA